MRIEALPIPHDCSDGFLYAFWRRPAAYCDPRLRQGSSSFWKLSGHERSLSQLKRDLASGAWEERYGHLLGLEELDVGYRLVTAGIALG